MKPILTSRLVIRNWKEEDRAVFHRINSDERVMEFFALKRDREASDRLMDEVRAGIDDRGYGFSAIEIRQTGACIGFTGLNDTARIPLMPEGTIEIGWRIVPEFWGKGLVTEAAEAWLEHGFETLGLKEIVSFAVWNNVRSIAVMKRIGMSAAPERDFDHPLVPDTHPHLKRHAFYRITDEAWRRRTVSSS